MNKKNHLSQVISLQFFRTAGPLIFFIPLMVLISLGVTIGYTLIMPEMDENTMLYLATGAPTIVIIMLGLVLLPLQNSTAKTEGYNEFLRTLPIKRLNIMVADIIIWICIALPGFIISTVVTHFIFDPGYAISFTIIPIFLLVSVTSISIGYGFSFALAPHTTTMLTQLIAFGSLMFSPINFPIYNLPNWFQAVHRVLPLHAMANVMRASLATTTYTASWWEYAKLILWCAAGIILSISILNRTKS